MCGIGTTLVEAIHLERRAIGVELERRWAALATANLAHALDQGARGRAGVIEGDARELPRLLAHHGRRLLNTADGTVRLPAGSVDLILTSPPYGNATIGDPSGGQGSARARATKGKTVTAADRACAGRAVRVCRYGMAPGNIGELLYRGTGDNDYLGAMGEVYAACATVLRPGGFLAIVTKELRAKGEVRNLAGDTVTLARQAGLQYWQHVIALHAAVRDGRLIARPSYWQLRQVRTAAERGQRRLLVCHEDVLVFRKPDAATATGTRAA